MSRFIVLYRYNNYYNRIVKTQASFQDYLNLITPGENTPAQFNGFLRESKNFNYADGVYTKHVVNISKNEPLFAKSESPDYFVLEETFKEGETSVTKLSRWFVLEADRIRGDQYELSLRRDLLADYFNQVTQNAQVFIQRGTPQVSYDPLIFNKEGFTFNQIKKHEILLNNNKLSGNKGGWVVGYLAREDSAYALNNCPCAVVNPYDLLPNYTDLPAQLRALIEHGYGWCKNDKSYTAFVSFLFKSRSTKYHGENFIQSGSASFAITPNNSTKDLTISSLATINSQTNAKSAVYFYRIPGTQEKDDMANIWDRNRLQNYIDGEIRGSNAIALLSSAFETYCDTQYTTYDFDKTLIQQYNGTYYIKDGRIYKISFVRSDDPHEDTSIQKSLKGSEVRTASPTDLGYAALTMFNNLLSLEDVIWNTGLDLNENCLSLIKDMSYYSVATEVADASNFDVTIPATRNTLLDSPYDMFCIPLGNVTVKRTGQADFVTSLDVAMAAARGIAVKGTSSRVLDIQILPYCPYPEIINSNGEIDLTPPYFVNDVDYTIVSNTVGQVTTNLSVIIYPKYSKGSFDYDLASEISNMGSSELKTYLQSVLNLSTNVLERKIISETSFIRFVSPNFSSMYDMIPQKNNGVDIINIDYYYKPYTPYIHVMPVLHDGGLYGKDYNDPKGLICSGDFSIATASSKWEDYQVQNKNFQNQFDRQIQNLDVNNSIALQKAQITGGIGIATSALSGAAAGAIAGSVIPGLGTAVGAVVGGAVGAVGAGVASAIGYTKDIEYLKQQQSEARGYAVDMYTYQLGNIQALPNTLNKVSAFTPNNKIFPFIEFYDCTDEEKEALRRKIVYNGMTIMKIDQIANYINSLVSYYVQGQLIRLEGIDEDSHVVAEIANEIKEGAYFYG